MTEALGEIRPGGTVHPTFVCCWGRNVGLIRGWRGKNG